MQTNRHVLTRGRDEERDWEETSFVEGNMTEQRTTYANEVRKKEAELPRFWAIVQRRTSFYLFVYLPARLFVSVSLP